MKFHTLALLFFLALTGCDKPQPPAPTPRPALVAVVGKHPTVNAMSLVGEVVPRYESSQGFRIDGKIIERKVEVGDEVKKGQVIAKLDPADNQLNTTAAKADIRAAEASVNLAQAELARYRKLYVQKFISASSLDIKEAELKTAQARLSQVQAKLNVSLNQEDYACLKADRDGIITQIRAEPGQVVETGDVIAKIADNKELEILVAVPESKIAQIPQDGASNIRLWANRERIYTGKVREIAPSADPATRAFNVKVAFVDADDAVKWGMTVRVRFNTPENLTDNGFLIPSVALTEINGKPCVWIIDNDNKAFPREVSPGPFTEHGVPINKGLAAGEKIAIAGVHTLVTGQVVKPVIEEGL